MELPLVKMVRCLNTTTVTAVIMSDAMLTTMEEKTTTMERGGLHNMAMTRRVDITTANMTVTTEVEVIEAMVNLDVAITHMMMYVRTY